MRLKKIFLMKTRIIFIVKIKKIIYYIDSVKDLNEEDIRNSTIEKILSGWVFEFEEHFNELLENDNENNEDYPKYLELRPNCFNFS